MDGKLVGAALRAGREQCGLTQAELAQNAGVTRQTIANWEAGHIPKKALALIFSIFYVANVKGVWHSYGTGQIGSRSKPTHADLLLPRCSGEYGLIEDLALRELEQE